MMRVTGQWPNWLRHRSPNLFAGETRPNADRQQGPETHSESGITGSGAFNRVDRCSVSVAEKWTRGGAA